MKTSTFEKMVPMVRGALAPIGVLFAVLSFSIAACIGGFSNDGVPEGDRCNPLSSHNECGSGLVCTGQGSAPSVPYCPENYCCSVDGNGNINSSNPNCQLGCNGGAAAICAATKDPGACAVAAGMPPPSDAGAGDGGAGD
jgi:hypothetical protein